jgi:hypothetical protein
VKIRGLIGRRHDADFDAEMQDHLRLLMERYAFQGMTPEDAMHAARRQFGNATLDDELSDEMSPQLKLSTADYVDRGMSLADAHRAAVLRFGGTLQTAEAYRDRQGFPLLESLWQDMRYAVRTLRRTPLFAVTVAATMGLGLGLVGSVFTILNAYLLKPIDLPNPHALYSLSWDTDTTRRQRFRLADYEALQPEARRFAGLAAAQDATVMQDSVSTPYRGEPQPVRSASLIVRAQPGAASVIGPVREQIRHFEPELPLYFALKMDDFLAATRWPIRAFATIFLMLAAIALILASVGLYALTAYGVTQRTREIGLRVALGAQARDVVWMFVRRTLMQLAYGLPVGLAGLRDWQAAAILLGRNRTERSCDVVECHSCSGDHHDGGLFVAVKPSRSNRSSDQSSSRLTNPTGG